jgi:hypothetical protein
VFAPIRAHEKAAPLWRGGNLSNTLLDLVIVPVAIVEVAIAVVAADDDTGRAVVMAMPIAIMFDDDHLLGVRRRDRHGGQTEYRQRGRCENEIAH